MPLPTAQLVEERLFGIQGELQTVLRISETYTCKYVLETKSRNSHQETLSDLSGRNMSIIFKNIFDKNAGTHKMCAWCNAEETASCM